LLQAIEVFLKLQEHANEGNGIKSLVSLLDDDDGQIVSHVEEKILSLGTTIIPFLEGRMGK
jgi:hypothetical protein